MYGRYICKIPIFFMKADKKIVRSYKLMRFYFLNENILLLIYWK